MGSFDLTGHKLVVFARILNGKILSTGIFRWFQAGIEPEGMIAFCLKDGAEHHGHRLLLLRKVSPRIAYPRNRRNRWSKMSHSGAARESGAVVSGAEGRCARE